MLKSRLCSFITCNKMHFITTFLHCSKLITATLHIRTAIQLSISLITQELLRKLFFSKCNVPPSVKKFRVLYRNSREIIMFRGALWQPTYQHQIKNSRLILLILVFISSSNPCRTAQWLGYGLEDLQEIYLFSKIPTQATSPHILPFNWYHRLYSCKKAGHECHHSPPSTVRITTGGNIPPLLL